MQKSNKEDTPGENRQYKEDTPRENRQCGR